MVQYMAQQQLRGGDPGALAGAGGLPLPGLPGAPFPPQMPVEPAVTVCVEGMKFQYQLTEDDLHKVFSRYGAVRSIRVDEAGSSGTITFHNFPDAQAAMQDLDGKVL